MEIRYSKNGRYVTLSDEDVERIGKKYLERGGLLGTRVPFFVFAALEAQKFVRRVDEANPVHAFTSQVAQKLAAGGRLN